jgi:hypothetical protein
VRLALQHRNGSRIKGISSPARRHRIRIVVEKIRVLSPSKRNFTPLFMTSLSGSGIPVQYVDCSNVRQFVVTKIVDLNELGNTIPTHIVPLSLPSHSRPTRQ